jgi:ABC-type multidrug transport system fused ATPase/permease subunit
MLLGFYEPTAGDIFIDNKSILTIGYNTIRKNVGYVQQDPFVFNDTVETNVSLGDENISACNIEDALTKSHAIDFVRELPDGVGTNLGEAGSKISGGQKQRISIARALAREPSILILDESTSALDKATMLDILEVVKEISKEKLVIAISHQQEVLDVSDQVYVLENRKIRALKS